MIAYTPVCFLVAQRDTSTRVANLWKWWHASNRINTLRYLRACSTNQSDYVRFRGIVVARALFRAISFWLLRSKQSIIQSSFKGDVDVIKWVSNIVAQCQISSWKKILCRHENLFKHKVLSSGVSREDVINDLLIIGIKFLSKKSKKEKYIQHYTLQSQDNKKTVTSVT